MSNFIKKWFIYLLPMLAIMLPLALMVTQPSMFIAFRDRGFDAYQMAFPRVYEDVPVRIIDIDDESLEKIGQWPWPRTKMARMIAKLQEAGVAAIGLDIMFSEPDRTSPQQILQLWDEDVAGNLASRLRYLPDHDTQFADIIANGGVIAGMVMTNRKSGHVPKVKAGYSFIGGDAKDYAISYKGAITSLPALQEAADGNGALNSVLGIDGFIRKIPLVLASGGNLYPSLAAETLRVAQGAKGYMIKAVEASGMTHIKIGHFEVPVDANGRMWLHYSHEHKERYIPAWQILDDEADLSGLGGMMLLVGTSAAGLKDICATPLGPALPGVEVHAQALEQILLNDFLTRPDWMLGAEAIFILLTGMGLIVVVNRVGALAGLAVLMAGLVIAVGNGIYGFTHLGLLIDGLTPVLTLILAYIATTVLRFLSTEREKKQIRGTFSQYMSPLLVEELAKHPEKLSLGGEMREMTMLFCDIRGFTTISEQFDAVGLTRFINRFLTPMTDVILSHKGVIDKYMGNCIMAFWNAPLDDDAHAHNACTAALGMVQACKKLNAEVEAEFIAQGKAPIPVLIGVGVNTGHVCVGNMGSDQRFDYSVLGDDVNLASRLEGQSKTYGVDIVIGARTKVLAPTMASLELDDILVKGKTEPVRIYALLGDESLAQDNGFIQFNTLWRDGVLANFRKQAWDEAEIWLHKAHAMAKSQDLHLDGLVELYAGRVADYRANPPGKDWDGVYRAKSK